MTHAIALTGGIATGKSTVCSLLKLHGYEIIDADKIAHKTLEESKEQIVEIFGSEYIKADAVDRKLLGKLVFGDIEAKAKLESLLHPKIRETIYAACAELDKKCVPYFVDIPLFFETKAYDIKPIVLIYAPKETQIERAMKRDSLTHDDALRRIENQIDIEKKREMADFVVNNSKDLPSLQNEVQRLIKYIKE